MEPSKEAWRFVSFMVKHRWRYYGYLGCYACKRCMITRPTLWCPA